MKVAAILGLGTRGRVWAEAFGRAGWVVRGFDPDQHSSLNQSTVPNWSRSDTISSAVADADWVVVSLPDRIELMQKVIQRAQAESSEHTIIGVTTRAFGVDDVQNCALRSASVVVAQANEDGGFAFDVSQKTSPAARAAAKQVLAELAAHNSLTLHLPDALSQTSTAESA